MLTYYCATACAELHVINGNEKGSGPEELYKVGPEEIAKLSGLDVFLDYTTGDYYGFKSVSIFIAHTN